MTRTRVFAAAKATLTTGEFTVKGAGVLVHSSSRVATMAQLLILISCSVRVSSFPSSWDEDDSVVGFVPSALVPVPELGWVQLSLSP